jgi:hypothetical protein
MKPRRDEKSPRRRTRRFVKGLAAGAIILVLLVVVMPYLVAWTPLKNIFLGRLAAGAKLRASVEQASFGWFAPLSVEGLRLTTADRQPLVELAAFRAERPWWQLMLRRPELGRFEVERPRVELVFDETDTNFSDVGGGGLRPAGNVPFFSADVTDASFVARRRGEDKALVTLTNMDLAVRVERDAEGRRLVVEPAQLLDHEPVTTEMCDAGLQLVVPVLADATWVEGEVSLALQKCVVPIGRGDEAQVEGRLDLHRVETGPKSPLLLQITQLVSLMLGTEPPLRVRIADESNVRFRVQQRRVWHEGLAFGLPEVSPDLVIRTSGWVGLDESLDLNLEIPLPVDRLRDSPWARQLSAQPLTLHVAGTLDDPRIDLSRDNGPVGQLLGGLLGGGADGEVPAAERVFGILNQVLGPRSEDDAGPSVDLRTLLDRIRERRGERGGPLLRRDDRPADSDEDRPNAERALLKGLLERILQDGESTAPDGDSGPGSF